MKKVIIFCSMLLISVAGICQQKTKYQLTGTVIDALSGQPIQGISISLVDLKAATITDSSGNYSFGNIFPGHTIIEVSGYGYKSLIEHLDFDKSRILNFTLSPIVIENAGVTITAVGSSISYRKAPVTISRINRNELLKNASTNIIDALSKEPGISQVSTGPAISKPVIRGLGFNRLIVVNDGIRQEGQQWGDEHGIEIDENSVSKIEIVKGPASVIYGSEAIAGVINITTTQAVPVNTIKGNIMSSFQTNGSQRSLFGNLGGNFEGFNWNAWTDYKASGDYTNKYDGKVFNSKYNELNFGGYTGYNGNWGFTHLIASVFDQNLGIIEGERNDEGNFIKHLPGGIISTPSSDEFNNIHPYVPYQSIRHSKIILDNSIRVGKSKFLFTAGYQVNKRAEFGNPDNPSEKELSFELGTFNYQLGYQIEKKGWITTLGANGMIQENNNKSINALIPDYSLRDIGGYLYFQKPLKEATFSGGLRMDHRNLRSVAMDIGGIPKFNAIERDFSNFSASAGMSLPLSHSMTLKINMAGGFRPPGISELASNGVHEGTNRYEYGNQKLSSENSFQGDLAWEFHSAHSAMSIGVFYNSVFDFIYINKLLNASGSDSVVLVDGTGIQAYKFNQQDAILCGFEGKIDIHPHPLDWLHWQSTLSFVSGRFSHDIENTKNLPMIPAFRMINSLKAELLPKGKKIREFEIYLELDKAFDQNHPFTAYGTETPTPGYLLLNAGANANFIRKSHILFSLYFSVSNIFDVGYQDHLNRLKYTDINAVSGRQGVFNMGRNFMIRANIPITFTTGKKKTP